ncbi:hypothetical protein F5888DRAFT_1693232 [Russula emetica]|nr:hypothetical protein F5888DRAFT_1693232 [Russula emetica]
MSARTALNKDLIMRRVSGRRHQARTATSSTSPTTDSDANVHFPHESNVQTSAVFSNVFARVESGFNHFRTVTHDHDARLAAISAVDKEVDATRQLLRSLLTRRNALAPISLLPPEILGRVFHSLALDEPPYSNQQNFGWIRTTHVCRHWRQVALDDSSLWARISGIPIDLNTALISEMLARARNALLEIDFDFDLAEMPGPDMSLLIPPHLSHTRALRLRNQMLESESVEEIFSREAPDLEHFQLSVDSPITFRDLGGTTLFKGQAPKLRAFCISQVCVPWSFIPRGQLTQLKIIFRDDEMSTADAPSLGDARQFIDLLVNCPALEILVLELCIPCDLSQSSRGQTVHLPRLSRLCVGGPSSRVTNLLKMLRLPSTTTLHLRCVCEFDSPHNDYHILPVVSAQLQTSVPVEIKSLRIVVGDLLHIVASTSLSPPVVQSSRDIEADMDGGAEFALSFDGFSGYGHWEEILERACKMLPISDLEFLSISTPDTRSSINWAELFKRCTNVTTIQAIGRGSSGFIRDLTPPNTKKGKKKKRDGNGTSAIPAPGPIIFPNLTSLLLEHLDFTETKSRSGVLYDVLANGLRQRNSTYHMPIRKIHVDHCVIPVKRANALKKLVTEFRWDEEEGLPAINAFDEFDDFGDYDSDFNEHGARWEDFFVGSTQAEWEWWENYSD